MVLVQTGRCPAPPGQPGSQPTRRLAHPVCPENEIRAAPIGIVGTPGGLTGLVLPFTSGLSTGIPYRHRVITL
jgi:hypothetical protein